MPLAAVTSVATFSAVLAESMVAIGLSTVGPNLFGAVGKAVKCAAEHGAEDIDELRAGLGALNRLGGQRDANGDPVATPADILFGILESVARGVGDIEQMDLLVPKTATLETEFEFQASDSYSGGGEVGGMIEMVTIKGGMQALYESRSTSRVKMKIDLVSTPFDMRCRDEGRALSRAVLEAFRGVGAPVNAELRTAITRADDAKLRALLALAGGADVSEAKIRETLGLPAPVSG